MTFLQLDNIDPREIVPGYFGRLIHSENMTVAVWQIEEGAPLPQHQHVHEQIAIVLEGQFELTVAGETRVLEPGAVAVISSSVPHSGRALTPCRLIDIFSPPREEYK
jgi:quercetin dioxygenase-like cupin family protein